MIKTTPSSTGTRSQFTPLAAQVYSVGPKPSALAHLLGDMILPQSMEGHSAKTVESIMNYSAGYSFHVYEHESKILKEIEAEHKECANKIQAPEELASQDLKAKNEVQNKLKNFASKVQYSLAKDMREEADKVVHQQIMRTRVDMMLGYHNDEWSSWKFAETVSIYIMKLFPMMHSL
ncbi:hypothetical protein AgCh_031985 [Apium graveolens]